ncbi:MAG: ATP-binding protein [Dehalococcoidia bacterium]
MQVHLRLEGEAADGPAVLSVQDQGVGIPAAELPSIFQRFHRASNVVGRIEGKGIGLAGAKPIVEQHGGTIVAESQEGAGTTITVRLPLSPPDLEALLPDSEESRPHCPSDFSRQT